MTEEATPDPLHEEKDRLARTWELLELERERQKQLNDQMEIELRAAQREREHAAFKVFVNQITQQAMRKNGNAN